MLEEQRGAPMQPTSRPAWPVRLGCAAAAAGILGVAAAGAQPLFDRGNVGFTAAQAARGEAAYRESCAACHGPDLDDGQFAPPVKGAAFRAHWHDQSPQALWSLIVKRMPPASPGSLDSGTYADIEAYLLQENGGKAGTTQFASSGAPAAAGASAQPAAASEGGSSPRVGAALVDNQDAKYRAVMAARQALLGRLTPVSDAMLRNPPAADWLMWRGTYATLGYSPLDQINRKTVRHLGVAWTLALPPSANEAAPLVHDGVLFIEGANTVEAVDAVDGSILWQYVRALPAALHNGRDARMKGLAIYENELYAPTADGHIVALDVETGKLRWDHAVVSAEQGAHPGQFDGAFFHISGGPLVAHGNVIVGVSLGIDTGGGDYIVGLDAHSGEEKWRFHTIARPGQPGGDSWNGAPVDERYGSGAWSIGSYDPDLNLVYFGTGNTYDVGTLLAPRPGRKTLSNNDALYTDSTLALDPDTGRLRWFYQHMNRDVWDLDWAFEQSLVTLPIDGKPTKLVVTGGKSAIFDAIDRTDGKYEFSKDLGLQNLIARIDPKTGKKIIKPEFEPQPGRTDIVCPASTGARSWPTTAIDPTTGYLYVPLLDNDCMDYGWIERDADKIAAGGLDVRLGARPKPGNDGNFGRVEAIDLRTGRVVWSKAQRAPIASSLLASAGGLVFSGARDRRFRAYDAATGAVLWQSILSASPSSSPATYSVDGVQYVAVVAGGGGAFDAGTRSLTPEIVDPAAGTTLWVFKLVDAGTAAVPQ